MYSSCLCHPGLSHHISFFSPCLCPEVFSHLQDEFFSRKIITCTKMKSSWSRDLWRHFFEKSLFWEAFDQLRDQSSAPVSSGVKLSASKLGRTFLKIYLNVNQYPPHVFTLCEDLFLWKVIYSHIKVPCLCASYTHTDAYTHEWKLNEVSNSDRCMYLLDNSL